MHYAKLFDTASFDAPTRKLSSLGRGWNGLSVRAEEQLKRAFAPLRVNIPTPMGGIPLSEVLSIPLPQISASLMPAEAVLLAAGRGSRMGALTESTPKPLLNVGSQPLINYTMDLMHAAGVRRFTITTKHLAEQMQDFAREQDRKIATYPGSSIKPTSQTSMFASLAAYAMMGRHSKLISNSDGVFLPHPTKSKTANPIANLIEAHSETSADITMLVCRKDNAVGHTGSGDYNLNGYGQVFWKPHSENGSDANYVYTGNAIVTPSFLRRFAPAGIKKLAETSGAKKGHIDSDTLHSFIGSKALENGLLPRFAFAVHDGPFYDVGSPDMIHAANDALSEYTRG